MDMQTAPAEHPEPLSYRVDGAARATGLSPATIKRKIADGSLPSRLVGGCRIILRDDLECFLREGA